MYLEVIFQSRTEKVVMIRRKVGSIVTGSSEYIAIRVGHM